MKDLGRSDVSPDLRITVLRAFGCIGVILVHVASFPFSENSEGWIFANIFSAIARFSVPFFFMITGALLLRKEEPLFIFFKKRLIRIFAPLLFWSIVYIFWLDINGQEIGNWAIAILTKPVMYHLWYLYAIAGITFFIPFLRKIFIYSSTKEKAYLLGLWIITSSIYPTLNTYFASDWNLTNLYHLNAFTGFIGYVFLGAVLYESNHAPRFNTRKFIAANGAGFVTTVLATSWLTWHISSLHNSPDQLFYSFLAPNVLICATTLFNLLMYLPASAIKTMQKAAELISENSLGIYGIHVLILDRLNHWSNLLEYGHWLWFNIPVMTLCVLGTSLLIVSIIRKIPVLKYVA